MQAFLHEKKNAKGEKAQQRLGATKEHNSQTPKQLSGKFKLASWSRKPRNKKYKVQPTREGEEEAFLVKEEIVQDEVRDLFRLTSSDMSSPPLQPEPSTPLQAYGSALPISIANIRTQELLYHCITPPSICPLCLTSGTDNTAFISNAFAINYDNAYKTFSITDSALLHATLCLVAQHGDLLRGAEESSENLFHKGEAMRLMNHRLLEDWHYISDADITAVAIFVILEVCLLIHLHEALVLTQIRASMGHSKQLVLIGWDR